MPFQPEHVKQALGILLRRTAQAAHGFRVTTSFPLAANGTIDPPYQGMKPPQALRQHLQCADGSIVSPNVDQFVRDDRLKLLGRAIRHNHFGQENRRPHGPHDRWPQCLGSDAHGDLPPHTELR
jgi:hypothetical protein